MNDHYLHLRVDDTRVLPVPGNVMNLRHEVLVSQERV